MYIFLILIGLWAFVYLLNRVRRLEETVNQLLTGKNLGPRDLPAGQEAAAPESVPPPPYTPVPAPTLHTESSFTRALTLEQHKVESSRDTASPEPAPARAPSEFWLGHDLEFKFGSTIFTGIGAIAVTFGLGFFLRYAFENNLITETMRVALGLMAGAALLIFGEITRKRFPSYGQIVTGGGLGILYLSIFASFNFYNLVSQPLAFLGMIAVTAVGVALAVRADSLSLAGFTQIGGFLTPLLLSNNVNNPHGLFLYLALLNVGVAAIAWHKLWRPLIVGSFFGTVILYILWFTAYYTDSQFKIAEGYASLFFFMFLAISLLQYLSGRAPQDESDLAILTLTPAAYLGMSYLIINPLYPYWMGTFTTALAAIYLTLALFLEETDDQAKRRFKQFLAGLGFVLLVIAAPIQFHKHWITIAWAAEAFVLTLLGFQIKSSKLRIFAQGIFFFVIMRLVLLDSTLGAEAVPWFNNRLLSFGLSALFFALTTALYASRTADLDQPEETSIISLLLIESSAVLLWGGSLEILDFAEHWWLSAFWPLVSLFTVVAAFGIKDMPGRAFALLVLGATTFRLIAFDAGHIIINEAWLNPRNSLFLIAILANMSVMFFYQILPTDTEHEEKQGATTLLLLNTYLLTMWMISAEIFDFHRTFWLPVAWALGALMAGWVSLNLNNLPLRIAAYGTFIIAGLRALGYESNVNLASYSPIFNSRVFMVMVLVAAASLFVYMLRQNREAVPPQELANVQTVFFFGINTLLLWLLSVEVIDFFKQKLSLLSPAEQFTQRIKYKNLQNASLSVAWTLYTIILLIVGIVRTSRRARQSAIVLFGVIIFKVFLYDTANLNNFYRFVSFITLGLILLLTGYLYQRYRDRITQFITIAPSP